MTRRDPIVEEVRKHRAQIAREHGNDIRRSSRRWRPRILRRRHRWCCFRGSGCAERHAGGPERRGGPTHEWSRRAAEERAARLIRRRYADHNVSSHDRESLK
jgi:hypothetical protein